MKKGEGKTTEAIRYAAQLSNVYIVAINIDDACRIADMASRMGADINHPLTYDELLRHEYSGQNIKGLIIDNADMLLQRITDTEIKMITATVTPQPYINRKDGCWNCNDWHEEKEHHRCDTLDFKIGYCDAEPFQVGKDMTSRDAAVLCGHDSQIYYGEDYWCRKHNYEAGDER